MLIKNFMVVNGCNRINRRCKWDHSFPLVISGHIHSEQRPQKNIFYPGSVIQHAFGESEDNGLLLLIFNGSKIGEYPLMVKKILDIPKMRTINVKISDFFDISP